MPRGTRINRSFNIPLKSSLAQSRPARIVEPEDDRDYKGPPPKDPREPRCPGCMRHVLYCEARVDTVAGPFHERCHKESRSSTWPKRMPREGPRPRPRAASVSRPPAPPAAWVDLPELPGYSGTLDGRLLSKLASNRPWRSPRELEGRVLGRYGAKREGEHAGEHAEGDPQSAVAPPPPRVYRVTFPGGIRRLVTSGRVIELVRQALAKEAQS